MLIVILASISTENRLLGDACMSLTEHSPISLIVLIEAGRTARELADEVLWVVFGT